MKNKPRTAMNSEHKELRKRLLQWHRNKQQSINIILLADSNYQIFRNTVNRRLGTDLDYYDAIKQANLEELQKLDMVILDEKLNF